METDTTTRSGRVAQLAEQRLRNAQVVGSTPTLASIPLKPNTLRLQVSVAFRFDELSGFSPNQTQALMRGIAAIAALQPRP